MTEQVHVTFTESETIWKRITVPLANGGALIFDLPDSIGREQFGEIVDQAMQEEKAQYLHTHKPLDWSVFADKVQAKLDAVTS